MFTYKNKTLSITVEDLTSKEEKTFNCLVQLGDSKSLALWTIEHQRRLRHNNSELYRQAYYS